MEAKRSPYIKHLFVCVNKRDPGMTCCGLGGTPQAQALGHETGEAIRQKLKVYVKEHGLKGKVRISSSGCMDLCAQGPNVMVYPDYRWYHHVSLSDVDRIIEEHLAPLAEIASAPSGPCNDGAVRALLFDVGNVLIRFDHRIAAREIAVHTQVSPEELYRLFFESPLILAHDEGRISTRVFYEELKNQIRLSLSYERFLGVWTGIFTPDPFMESLVRGLLARSPCFVISNTNRPHFEYCRRQYPILNEFAGWILSYEVGALKPHPAIYRRALEVIRLPAPCILYVDDREDLIEAARPFGFQVHRFSGAESFAAELKVLGMI